MRPIVRRWIDSSNHLWACLLVAFLPARIIQRNPQGALCPISNCLSWRTAPRTASDLQPILARFEAQHHVKVKVRVFSWETGWTELVKFALYGHGPDVSEIGSTWASTLAATNALHAFSVREIAAVGGRYAFLHPSWQSCYIAGEPEMWAIPWLSNVRLVFYRADRLQRAGSARAGNGALARPI